MRGGFRQRVRWRPDTPGWALTFLAVLVLACAPALSARAQEQDESDPSEPTGSAPADSIPDETAGQASSSAPLTGRFDLSFEPKAGVRANVTQFTYYADWRTKATLARGATATKTLNWNWDEFRKQDKTVENRKGALNYNFGSLLPLTSIISGSWNWSEDRTTNSAGFANLLKVDSKLVNLNLSRYKFKALGLRHSARVGANYTNRISLNQNRRNDFREGTASANVQSSWAPLPGVVVVGRLGGTTTGGTRLLAGRSRPSSASGDSVGIGIYVDRGIGTGLIQLTRSNFEKQYLEFRRNANGLVDTVGVSEELKVVNELETKDALTLNLEHTIRLGRFTGTANASHTTDDLAYAFAVEGLRQRAADTADLALSYGVGRDSVAVTFRYGWSWDDQHIRAATSSRGRQYVQERDFQANWYHRLFKDTRLTFQYHEGLTQDIAERRFNENDNDRQQLDFSGRVDRLWPGRFRSTMGFSYRQSQDVSIRGTSSSNNNRKDSYELTPGYSWNLAPWFTFDQNYRVYIQYTDYLFSYLATVTRRDDYNKRGDLTTKITFVPNQRLTIILRHDFNRRFNAAKTSEDAAGSSFYDRNLEQDISRIDLDLKYIAAPGVTLELGTYRTRDDKTSLGRTSSQTRTDSGNLVMGSRVDRTWGARKQFQVSALIKKINAYGPSVTASSSDYWEADAWLKWQF